MNPTPVMQQTDDMTDDTTAEALAGTSRASGAAARPRPGLVAFTGTGPGDTGLLTLRAADLLGQAGCRPSSVSPSPAGGRGSG